MSSFSDLMFGSSSGSSSETTLTPEQQQIATLLMGYLSPLIGQPVQMGTSASNIIGSLTELLQGFTPQKQQATEEYFQEAIREPSMSEFERETLPEIKEAYAGLGTFWGTPRAKAEADARIEMEETLSATRAGVMESARTESEANALSAMSMLQSFALLEMPEFSPVLDQAFAFLSEPMQQTVVEEGSSGLTSMIIPLLLGLLSEGSNAAVDPITTTISNVLSTY